MSEERQNIEWLKCSSKALYMVWTYVWIYNATLSEHIRFKLWPAQRKVLTDLFAHQLVIILKARQLGMTWLCLAYALWIALFRPVATVLLFSKRDDEAVELLSRVTGMYERLPAWMKCREVITDNDHEWELSNGSVIRAFPTTAGDSYTATLAIVDEADLVPDLGALMRSVKPTIDAGGQMILLSRSDKDRPQSRFKRMYRAAKEGKNEWHPIFLPWQARPERDEEWYRRQKRDVLENTGALDDLYEQYPETDTEALSGRTLSKRIPPDWLERCYEEVEPVQPEEAPALLGLRIYEKPAYGRRYVAGGDPAEGLPESDDSAATWLDAETGAEVAHLSGKIQPDVFAAYVDQVSTYFNRAAILCERNNHGHAVIQWLREHSRCRVLDGHDGRKGWNSSTLGKSLLYTECASQLRDGQTTIHTFKTRTQLGAIDRATLRAPEGEHDDCADSYALAQVARSGRRARRSRRQTNRMKGASDGSHGANAPINRSTRARSRTQAA